MSVLLPAPFSPMTATTSPGRSASDTPRSAFTPGKVLTRLRASSSGGDPAPPVGPPAGPAAGLVAGTSGRPTVEPLIKSRLLLRFALSLLVFQVLPERIHVVLLHDHAFQLHIPVRRN